MKFNKIFFSLVFCVIGCCSLITSAYAAAPYHCATNNNADSWHFMIAPYGWIAWDNGNITVLNRTAKIDMTPKDIMNSLDSGLQLHLEANKNKCTFMLDTTYMQLSDSSVSSLGTTKVKYTQVLVDFGAFYKFKSYPVNNCQNRLDVEGFFGGRYWYLKNEISLPINWSVNRSKKWLDPVVGGRLLYHIKNKWALSLNGNIGGFGLISNFTWQAKAIAVFKFNRYVGIGAGFHALYINYEDGKNLTKFKLRKTTYGPMAGIVITF